jgi:hypothetical protein
MNVFVAYSAVETFIRSKYERKIYMRKSTETIPPNKEVVTKPKKESSLVKGKQPTETVQPRSRQIQSKPRPPQTQPSPVKQQDQLIALTSQETTPVKHKSPSGNNAMADLLTDQPLINPPSESVNSRPLMGEPSPHPNMAMKDSIMSLYAAQPSYMAGGHGGQPVGE